MTDQVTALYVELKMSQWTICFQLQFGKSSNLGKAVTGNAMDWASEAAWMVVAGTVLFHLSREKQ